MIKRISDEEYFAIDAVSNSLLSRLAKCPAALKIQTETTPAMKLGSLVHCLILEGAEAFWQRYAVAPDVDRRTKAGKEEYQAFCEANAGKIVVSIDDITAAEGMAGSVFLHPSCQSLLRKGEPEMAITWEEEGLNCKAKADWLAPNILIDLKTTTDASEHMFSRTITNSAYFRQMAFYRSGLRKNGAQIDLCAIIAVESKPPYACSVFSLSEEFLEAGEGYYKGLLHKYKEVIKSAEYPAYYNAGIVEVYPPAWLNN